MKKFNAAKLESELKSFYVDEFLKSATENKL